MNGDRRFTNMGRCFKRTFIAPSIMCPVITPIFDTTVRQRITPQSLILSTCYLSYNQAGVLIEMGYVFGSHLHCCCQENAEQRPITCGSERVVPTLVKSMHSSIMLKATCTYCRSNYALIDTVSTQSPATLFRGTVHFDSQKTFKILVIGGG